LHLVCKASKVEKVSPGTGTGSHLVGFGLFAVFLEGFDVSHDWFTLWCRHGLPGVRLHAILPIILMSPTRYQYDVIVIGAGHAGTEAAAVAARLGAKTALLTTNLDTVGQMSCNPAIGGVAKGQIVREVDALGGLMGQAIDATGIQFRLLNCRKGPAMHSPRAQADKKAYQQFIKLQVEQQQNLDLRQETVDDLITQTSGSTTRIIGVRVRGDA
jgi:hypothetical protein